MGATLLCVGRERRGIARERFDDTDDFNNYTGQPAEDTWGVELGRGDDAGGLRHPNFQVRQGYFDAWRHEIEVYYVDEGDPSVRLPAGETSSLRAAEVHIYYENPDGSRRELANLRRVYAYVPTPE